MAKLRVYKAALAGINPALRVYTVSADGSIPSVPKLRVYKISGAGTVAVGFNSIDDRTFEPMTTCTTTVTALTGAPTIDTYTWRQVSGPTVTLTGSGDTRSFVVPSVTPPSTATVIIGVTGTSSGVSGPERQFKVFVLPQTRWSWNGSSWVGAGHLPQP